MYIPHLAVVCSRGHAAGVTTAQTFTPLVQLYNIMRTKNETK
jgi:hypothetical protein